MLMDMKGLTDAQAIMVGEINTTLSATDRSYRVTINKETSEFKSTIHYMDLSDMPPTATEYTVFLIACGTWKWITF